MSSFAVPPAAVPAEIRRRVPLQIVSPSVEPPQGDGWLHEVRHDGHRLVAVVADGAARLLSRNGHDRVKLFGEPFRTLAAAELPAIVLNGEIAAPDERGVTHIDALNEALRLRRPDQLACFAFDLLFLDGHDLRGAALRDVVGAAGYPRLVAVDHIIGSDLQLFAAVRQLGAEGIASKRAGSPYRRETNRDWLKTKVSETGAFVVTGYIEREAVAGAELQWLASAGWVDEVRACRQGSVAAPRPVARRAVNLLWPCPGASRTGRRGQVFRALPNGVAE